MFAGEGDAFRTNRRFQVLSADSEAKRLSTAFDSVTLYGRDPDTRPDVYGKVGTSGVSICTVDDAVKLYSGFDLLASNTSVSMTINGPAPVVLALFLNTAATADPASRREGAAVRRGRPEAAAYAFRNVPARCRPTSSRRTGARILHLLHRVLAAMMADVGVVHRPRF
jgi:methylmalonyl-CoA mutase